MGIRMYSVFLYKTNNPIMATGCVILMHLLDDIELNLFKKRGQTYEGYRYC